MRIALLVSGRIPHFVSESALQLESLPSTIVIATFTVFRLIKWPTSLPCMSVLFLTIAVQITCHHRPLCHLPPRQHKLLLKHLHPHLQVQLLDRERENSASAQQKAAMDWDTKNEQDGLKVTQQKQDVLGVSKSFLTCWSYHAIEHHFTSLPTVLTFILILLLLPKHHVSTTVNTS